MKPQAARRRRPHQTQRRDGGPGKVGLCPNLAALVKLKVQTCAESVEHDQAKLTGGLRKVFGFGLGAGPQHGERALGPGHPVGVPIEGQTGPVVVNQGLAASA
jgi:hypothetical protein